MRINLKTGLEKWPPSGHLRLKYPIWLVKKIPSVGSVATECCRLANGMQLLTFFSNRTMPMRTECDRKVRGSLFGRSQRHVVGGVCGLLANPPFQNKK